MEDLCKVFDAIQGIVDDCGAPSDKLAIKLLLQKAKHLCSTTTPNHS